MNYVILGVLILIIIFYTNREGFTSEGKLTEYLNTWKATNDELAKTIVASDNRIDMNKNVKITGNLETTGNVNFPRDKGIKLGFLDNIDSNDYQGSIRATPNEGVHIVGTKVNNARLTKFYDKVHVHGDLSADNDLTAPHIYAKNQLCIDNVCINADHLRILKGEKDISIYPKNLENKCLKEQSGWGVPENARFADGCGDDHRLRMKLR